MIHPWYLDTQGTTTSVEHTRILVSPPGNIHTVDEAYTSRLLNIHYKSVVPRRLFIPALQ